MLQKAFWTFFRLIRIILLSDYVAYVPFILLSGVIMMKFVDRSYVFYTPWVIFLIFIILIFKTFPEKNWKFLFILFLIGFLGFFIEVLGVETQIIFGTYYYGDVLGIKLFNVPLILGINWIIVAWGALSLAYHVLKNLGFEFSSITSKLFLVFISAVFAVIFDIVLEPVAIDLGFWYWNEDTVPLQNYIAWFLITFFFNILIIFSAKNEFNKTLSPTAAYIFVYFGIFF